MKKGDHGKKSKLLHIRLRSPKQFTKMRTVDRGQGIKQVIGKVKGKDEWRAQNIMIPKAKAKKRGSKISIKTKKLRDHLKDLGLSVSKIKHMKSRGENDYKHPAPPTKMRSKGKGRGKGYGRGAGPRGIPKNMERRK